jgi:hypothetical protein
LTNIIERSRWVYAYLNQGKLWFPNGKPAVQIADMDEAWRHNAAAFLERNPKGYALHYGFGEIASIFGATAREVIGEVNGKAVLGGMVNIGPTPGSMAEAGVERELEESAEKRAADPETWIRTTTLHKALVAGLPTGKKKRAALAALARHWSQCPVRGGTDPECICASRTAEARADAADMAADAL